MMRFLYGVIGVVAKVSESMSRTRVNGVPGNWGIILCCGLFSFMGWALRQETLSAPRTPQRATVAEVYQGASHARYLTVTGEIHPEAALGVEGKHSSYELVPVIDRASGKGFFVEAAEGAYGQKPRQITLTGTTHGLDSTLRGDLAARVPSSAKMAFNTNISLVDGQTPGDPFWSLIAMIGFGALCALFLSASLLKYTVFQRDKNARDFNTQNAASPFSATSAVDSAATSSTRLGVRESETPSLRMRLTGKMRLTEKITRRFLDVPVFPLELENGQIAFASNIDASSRFYGVVTQKRDGVWLMTPRAQSLRFENGWLYNGWKPAPALRLRFNDATDKDKSASAVLAFDDETSRSALVARLQSANVNGSNVPNASATRNAS